MQRLALRMYQLGHLPKSRATLAFATVSCSVLPSRGVLRWRHLIVAAPEGEKQLLRSLQVIPTSLRLTCILRVV